MKVKVQRLSSDILNFVYVCVDPTADPAAVQRVCDGVLGVKLPETVDALKKKLKEIQDVAASLPDTSMVLKNASSGLQEAQQLLQNAENARYTTCLHANTHTHILTHTLSHMLTHSRLQTTTTH